MRQWQIRQWQRNMISPIVLCLCIPHFGKIWICSPKSLFQLLLIPNLQSWGDEKSLTLIIWHLVILFWPFVKTFSSTASNENIAKGTTDPRVEFISQVQTKILIKFHLQNLDQGSTSKSQPNVSLSIKLKLQIVANTILISNSYNINKFGVGIFTRQGDINQVY